MGVIQFNPNQVRCCRHSLKSTKKIPSYSLTECCVMSPKTKKPRSDPGPRRKLPSDNLLGDVRPVGLNLLLLELRRAF